MPQIDRFSVSLDTELLAAFDTHISSRGYDNRSEAIRDMIRDLLVDKRPVQGEGSIAGVLMVVCDHQVGEAMSRLRDAIVQHADIVRGSLLLPVDEHHDGLAIALRGPAHEVQTVADKLQAMRGITHGHLWVVPSGE